MLILTLLVHEGPAEGQCFRDAVEYNVVLKTVVQEVVCGGFQICLLSQNI
jgi:hypothetical protein